MALGTLTLDRFNGQEVFEISSALINTFDSDTGVDLNFEIETEAVPLKTLPDTVELRAQPKAEFTVSVNAIDWNTFLGSSFKIPLGYDEGKDECVGSLYYAEHGDIDECVIKVLEQETDSYRVQIEGSCVDVNYYDESKPPTKITIDAWFKRK